MILCQSSLSSTATVAHVWICGAAAPPLVRTVLVRGGIGGGDGGLAFSPHHIIVQRRGTEAGARARALGASESAATTVAQCVAFQIPRETFQLINPGVTCLLKLR